MRILLDECVPKRLRSLITGHDVISVPDAGWAGVKNGDLLVKATTGFDVFLTVDRNLTFQQKPSSLTLPVVVLKSVSTRLKDLAPLVPQLLYLLQTPLEKIIYTIEG